MRNGLKLLGILFAMTGLLASCGNDDDFTPIIITTPTPTITAVAPSYGLPGTTVTITGTNFSTTPADNVVKFNGTTAVVTSSTSTQIVTTVPAGATSGFITVARGSKIATSPSSFTVTVLMGGAVQGNALSLANTVTTFAGTTGTSGSFDAIGTAASFSHPAGVTTDGTNLFVADYNNRTIRKIEIATGTVTTLAGTAGVTGFADGTGAAASFNGPAGITNDGTNLYVTDWNNNAIRKIVISTGVVTTLAGNGTPGSTDGIGTAATFNQPAGITTDGTNLYVADYNGQIIRKIVISTVDVTTFAGTASTPGSTDAIGAAARFHNPHDVTTDGTNLYVADFTNNTIRKIEIATAAVTTLAGTAGVLGSADGTGAAASFNGPAGVTTDGTNVYVTDRLNHTIRKIVTATGAVTTLAGTAGTFGSADGTGTAAMFNQPVKITTDGTNLYVTDWNNFTIRKIQ